MLMQSLRAVGYTTPAAVADLVDNSIAAAARKVAIRFTAAPEPLVAVIDDGEGMDEKTLVAEVFVVPAQFLLAIRARQAET